MTNLYGSGNTEIVQGSGASAQLLVEGYAVPDAVKYVFLGPLIGAAARVVFAPLTDRTGGAVWTLVSGLGLIGSIAYTIPASPRTPARRPRLEAGFDQFLYGMLAIFLFAGIGNASTFKQMPMIFERRQAGGVIGWTAAIAAFGPFFFGIGLTTLGAGDLLLRSASPGRSCASASPGGATPGRGRPSPADPRPSGPRVRTWLPWRPRPHSRPAFVGQVAPVRSSRSAGVSTSRPAGPLTPTSRCDRASSSLAGRFAAGLGGPRARMPCGTPRATGSRRRGRRPRPRRRPRRARGQRVTSVTTAGPAYGMSPATTATSSVVTASTPAATPASGPPRAGSSGST